VFWFLALFAAVSMLGVFAFMPETVGAHNRQSIAPLFILQSYGRALRHGPFMGLTLVFALLFSGMFLYIAAAPMVLVGHLHQTPTDFWKFFVPLVTGLILGSRVSNFLASRYAPMTTVSIGIGFAALAISFNVAQSIWFAHQPAEVSEWRVWLTVSPIMFYAMGMATSMPSLNLMGLDYIPAQRGLASALQGFAQMILAGIVSGFAVAHLAQNLLWLAWGMAALWLLAALIWIAWYRQAPRLGFASETRHV
jgi:DHA1 family bicyclomycin/chloramphenicol resistance-like MFS transporter